MKFEPIVEVHNVPKIAIFIPTNLPAGDPRDISKRALARFEVGMKLARRMRDERGRANVLVVVFGGWPLHGRLPLSIQHVYAASKIHKIFDLDELDFVMSYGINTVTDLHGTLSWMRENIAKVSEAHIVTSKGHAHRMIAESMMNDLFPHIYHVESFEPRDSEQEDELWLQRAKSVPPHQYLMAARSSEVSRFGSIDSLEWLQRSREWAEAYPDLFTQYMDEIWQLVHGLEENNVALLTQTPGSWRLRINC